LRTRLVVRRVAREHFDFDNLTQEEQLTRAENYLARRWRFPRVDMVDFGHCAGGDHNRGWCDIEGLRLAQHCGGTGWHSTSGRVRVSGGPLKGRD